MNGFLEFVAEAGPGVVIRATGLFAVAAVVSLAVARASAAQRHLVWVAALLAALALPAIHAWAPAWPVWPAAIAGRPATLPARSESTPRLEPAPPVVSGSPVAAGAVALHESPEAEPAASRAVLQPLSQTVPVASPPTAAAARTVSLAHGLAAVWLVGVCYSCARLAVAYAGIRQLARRADPAGGRTAALLAELATAAGIRRRVRGLVSRESVVPMTWGWLRPVVLLPAEAGSWSAERLRVVLQHELAHVSRWDALTQFVAELARSVYWFHPLAWWYVRRLRADQEAACDDCVLAAGAAADDYAEELLAVTARLPRVASGLQGTGVAVAMGRAGRLEERVRALLAFDRDRRPVNPWRAAAVASVFAAVATLAAIIGPAADAEDKAASSPAKPGAAAAPSAKAPADALLRIRSLTPEEAERIIREKQYQPQWRGAGQSLQGDPKKLRATLSGMGFTAIQIEALMDEIENLPSGEEAFFRAVCSGVSPSLADVLNRCSNFLVLPAVDTLDEATAAVLAGEELDPMGGRRLSAMHDLHLPGITSLDAKAGMALVRASVQRLSLRGLKNIDAAKARALASGNLQALDLSGLRSLDAEAARELAGVEILDLSGLESLDAATAQALADGVVETVFLSGLRTLDADAAKALGSKRNWQQLDLRSLRTLDAAAATALKRQGTWIHDLDLSGLESLDAATATALVTCNSSFRLDISGVRSLDVATAMALAAGTATLDLSGLTSLDPDVAQALSNRALGGRMTLNGLTTLDAETAKALMSGSGAKGGYWLSGLLSLDAATATALASGAPAMLILDGLESLDADTAAALTSGAYEPNRVCYVSLRGLDSLEPAAAEALVKGLDCRRCHADVPTSDLMRGCTAPASGERPTKTFWVRDRLEIRPAR